jgi:hypothetical protein
MENRENYSCIEPTRAVDDVNSPYKYHQLCSCSKEAFAIKDVKEVVVEET